ncbi:MAG: rhodanese-like domain-containing protein [Candidatus Pacebacteria bacterium]|nr:rhodanese-like domain-containing protein [Candidatus Paceibacterota bacterium]
MIIIDVRTKEEFDAGHIAGAVHLPIADIELGEFGAVGELSREVPIRVHCMAGGRAGRAAKTLRDAGFSDVENVGGVEGALTSCAGAQLCADTACTCGN